MTTILPSTSQDNPDIKAILFDKDGTLIDFTSTWLPRYEQAAVVVAQAAGSPELAATLIAIGGYDAEAKRWEPDSVLAAGSNSEIFAIWSQHLGFTIEGDTLYHCQTIFAHNHGGYVAAVDDITSLLSKLRAKNLVLGVATMDDVATAHATLASMQINHCFDFVCGADSGYGLKPDPGMINAFCEQTQIPSREVIMVGDSPRDLTMGRHAGAALCVGVLTGAHDADALTPHADWVFDDIGGLLQLV